MQFKDKSEVRKYVWDLMFEKKIAIFPLPPHGRIPNFSQAKKACFFIKRLPEYKDSRCIFCGPDSVLRPLRDLVLSDGKILAYATPHMREMKMIRPNLSNQEKEKINTSIKGLIEKGEKLVEKVQIAVVGSVAVDEFGNRLGKGSGYGDKEIQYLKEKNLVEKNFKTGTLVHTVQFFGDISKLSEPHDIPVDFLLTQKSLIFCKR